MKFNIPFLRKNVTRVGLDIGSYNIKIAQVQIKNNAFKITALGIKDIRQEPDIIKAIKQLLEETHISVKEVNISLSGENIVARYLSLPKMTEAELHKAMSYELEDHIPFKPEEVHSDYYILGEEKNSKNRMKVLLVAAKKELLETRLKIIEKTGLIPRVITMDALAVKNTFYFNYPQKNATVNVALLNIGDKNTNLLIAHEQIPYFIRDTRFGGEMITSSIQTKSGIAKKDAEKLKNNPEGSAEILQIIKSSLSNNLLNEIFVSLDFYENLTERKIDEIYISGGSSQLAGIKELLGGYLGLGVFALEPFKNFSFAPNIPQETLASLAPYFSVAIGLALEEH